MSVVNTPDEDVSTLRKRDGRPGVTDIGGRRADRLVDVESGASEEVMSRVVAS